MVESVLRRASQLPRERASHRMDHRQSDSRRAVAGLRTHTPLLKATAPTAPGELTLRTQATAELERASIERFSRVMWGCPAVTPTVRLRRDWDNWTCRHSATGQQGGHEDIAPRAALRLGQQRARMRLVQTSTVPASPPWLKAARTTGSEKARKKPV